MNAIARVSLSTLMLVLSLVTAAQADTTIRTDRVNLSVGDDGTVHVHTRSSLPALRDGVNSAESLNSSPYVNQLINCHQRSQQHHHARTDSRSGSRVVSQSSTQTTICR